MDQMSASFREFEMAFSQLEEQMKDGMQELHEVDTIPYTKDYRT